MSLIKSLRKENVSTEFKCDLCNYKALKPNTLKKHINTKHTMQKCKVCDKEFKTSMDLVSHVAKEHIEEEEEEEEWNIEFQSTPKSGKELK